MRFHPRLRHALSLMGKILGYGVLGLAALVGVVLLAINLPPVSGWIAGQVNAALEPTFKGRLVLHRLGHLDFGGITDADLEVLDPAGRSVLVAHDIDVRLFWPGVAWQAVVQRPQTLRVPIDRVALRDVELTLIDDGNGSPTLAQAFEPREPAPEEVASGGTAIQVDELAIETTRVRGALAAVGPIDTDLGQLMAQLSVDPNGTHVVLEHLAIDARQVPQVGTVTGRLTADVTLPAAPTPGAPAPAPVADRASSSSTYALMPAPVRRIVAGFDGNVAGSNALADVRLVGEQLAASVEAASLLPSTLSRLVPALAPQAPLSLSAKVNGLLTDLAFEARLAQQAAEVNASGRFARKEALSRVTAKLAASKIDLSRLLPGGAKTALDVDADAALDLGERGGTGSYHVVSEGSTYAGQTLPKASLDGKLHMPASGPLATQGRLQIAEPGAPTDIDFDVRSGDDGTVADVKSLTRITRPRRLRQLAGGAQLTGEIASKAHYDASRDQLDAELRASLSDLRHPQGRAAQLDLSALARGRASAPNLELLMNVTGVSAGERKWSRVRLHARGTSEQIVLDARAYGDRPDEVRIGAILRPGSAELVRSPVIRVQDEAGNLVVRAARVVQNGGLLSVERLTIDGAGRATASLAYGKGLERLTLDAKQLDVARLLRIAGVDSALSSAKLDADLDLHGGGSPRGKLALTISDIGLGQLRGGTAAADFEVSAGKLSGKADVELTRGAKTHIAVDGLKLPMAAGAEPTLDSLNGDIELSGSIDLANLQPMLPLAGIERATGQLRFEVSMKRNQSAASFPAIRARLSSRALVLVSERPGAEQKQSAGQARTTAPWTLRGVDFNVDAGLENQTATLEAHLFDGAGEVLALVSRFEQLRDLSNLRQAFQRAPLSARLDIPRRAFDHWPTPIRPAEIQGVLSLQVDASGSLAEPDVQARGRIDGFAAASTSRRQRRVDLELGAQYRRSDGNIRLRARERGKSVLGVDARWSGDVALAAAAPPSPDAASPLLADVKVELADFPIDTIPQLETRHIKGSLSGKMLLEGLGRDAHFTLDLGAKRLKLDRLTLNDVEASVKTSGKELNAKASLRGGGGGLALQVKTGFDWGKRLIPVLDRQLDGHVTAQKFPLASLQPLVDGSVSEVGGKLDADIRATLEGGQPRLNGQAELSEGVLQLPTIGQRFSDISAKLAITPDHLRVFDVKARGVSGGFSAEAEAQLSGLSPVSAKATLKIDEDDKLPLTVEGEAIGDAWGSIETLFRVDEAKKLNDIQVNLKKFHVELPGAPPQGIQDLAQAEHVRVGYWRQDRKFVTIPLQPMEEPSKPSEYATVVTVDLGELWVEKGDQVEVGVGGKIQAKLGPELDVTGKIETRRGELFVSGKSFDIESGTVTFTGGPPDNPIISAVARYDSPAGYTVYAEYTGTATQGTLGLRSEPPLSQDEILTLLMFGTPDGSFGAGSGSGDDISTAVSVVGSTAAQGLNRAISKVTDLDVSARVDTSTGAPRPELVLQVTPRIAARITQALGEPSPGQSPDRTFVTIELRVASAWALSTTVGDRGASAVDVIWRRRY